MPARSDSAPEGMPPAAAEVFCYLKGEIIRTRRKWIYYRQLFMEGERRVHLLNGAGGNFFAEVQNVLTSDLILSVARLTDPIENRRQQNLTVALFIHRLMDGGFGELVARLQPLETALQQRISPLRKRRSKIVAHYDSATILTPAVSPLPGLTLQDIYIAMQAIEELLGVAHTHFTGGIFAWDMTQTQRDADKLMTQLCKAEVYDRLVEEGKVDRYAWRTELE